MRNVVLKGSRSTEGKCVRFEADVDKGDDGKCSPEREREYRREVSGFCSGSERRA